MPAVRPVAPSSWSPPDPRVDRSGAPVWGVPSASRWRDRAQALTWAVAVTAASAWLLSLAGSRQDPAPQPVPPSRFVQLPAASPPPEVFATAAPGRTELPAPPDPVAPAIPTLSEVDRLLAVRATAPAPRPPLPAIPLPAIPRPAPATSPAPPAPPAGPERPGTVAGVPGSVPQSLAAAGLPGSAPGQTGPPGSDPFRDARTVERPPRAARTPPPPYPETARRAGWEGEFRVRIWIGADGSVTRLEILEARGPEILRQAVERAVAGWRYHPAEHGGRPVPVTVTTTVEFRIPR